MCWYCVACSAAPPEPWHDQDADAKRDDAAGTGLFSNPGKTRRLFSTMHKIAAGTLRSPSTHADNAGLTIAEEESGPGKGKSLLSKLHRKWRLESKRPHTLKEVYPDEAPERQRKHLVRKTVTHILNLAAVKHHKTQQEQIAELERVPLPAPSGLKSLGWRGDERFQVPDTVDGRAMVVGGKKGGKKGSSEPTRTKPVLLRVNFVNLRYFRFCEIRNV